ncbi:Protein turtle [Folsomia candida]|uniref:Protein turtle n=1 Tax=Folsomia candida TaxID=158441 RepID=A0A226EVH8_FOLCA|nr:Protein turtle [Folsomia candida]
MSFFRVVADQVQAVLGNIAELPCDLNVASGDKIRLVLWSRDTSTVIYSLDAREKQIEEAQHWSNEQALGGRAYFRSSADPPSLIIENVKESDGGLYKCRLDYKRSPTLYHNVNLTIIIPPKQVVVVDERGTEMNSMIIGPYNEGEFLIEADMCLNRRYCKHFIEDRIQRIIWLPLTYHYATINYTLVSSPLPKVSWWRENALLDDTWEVSSEHVTSTVVSNTLTISRLQRSDLNARLTCQAANSNISVPVSTTVTLDLSFRPLNVKILDGKPALSAEKEYTLDCQSTGARPPSVITWLKGSTRLKHHKETTSSDGNVTTSRLTFIPTMEDMGKTLICQAENPQIPGSTIEDGFKMDIHLGKPAATTTQNCWRSCWGVSTRRRFASAVCGGRLVATNSQSVQTEFWRLQLSETFSTTTTTTLCHYLGLYVFADYQSFPHSCTGTTSLGSWKIAFTFRHSLLNPKPSSLSSDGSSKTESKASNLSSSSVLLLPPSLPCFHLAFLSPSVVVAVSSSSPPAHPWLCVRLHLFRSLHSLSLSHVEFCVEEVSQGNFKSIRSVLVKYLWIKINRKLKIVSSLGLCTGSGIYDVPQVTLELGSTLNSSFLRENADVYFECNIKATPFVQRVTWRQNARLLHHNASAGVIISNQSLVLQSITRKSAGLYTCIGTNKEGDGTSNAVSLNVKYAPVCKVHQQTIYGIARQEQAKILCEVDANPDTDLHFRWKFNNSAESIDIQQSHFTIERLRSTLTYKPMTELDYGTVLCWASHESVGAQKVPCVYHIIPAGKPDAVSNCSILNTTFDSLFVSCVEGFNGGLQQFFVIEIWDRESRQVLRNLTNPRPVFHVRTLEPGSTYVIRIYAANNKGRSETQVLQASTLKAAEKHTSINAEASSIKPAFGFKMIPVLAVIAAIIATIIIVAVVIVLVIRSKGHGGEDKRLPKNNAGGFKSNPDHDNSAVPLKKSMDDILDPDDKNPDVVPHGSGNYGLMKIH